ncbi:MAG: hypothetical protein D6705_18860 [Deltaproteobacteria bacterium]|nr:MAG: hypothetical protein D6705_18860 [Deltaproteobacteria bacterium]
MSLTNDTDLTKHLARVMGLSESLGPEFIRRAFLDAGEPFDAPSVGQFERVLPYLEARLSAFVGADDAASRLARLRRELAALADRRVQHATTKDTGNQSN